MKKKLEQGITLVVDRYSFSGVAFTSAKPVSLCVRSRVCVSTSMCPHWRSSVTPLQGFSVDWCKQPEVGLPKPDLVMFLKVSLAEAALRGQYGQERYETSAFQMAVQEKFDQLIADTTINWQVIEKTSLITALVCSRKLFPVLFLKIQDSAPSSAQERLCMHYWCWSQHFDDSQSQNMASQLDPPFWE